MRTVFVKHSKNLCKTTYATRSSINGSLSEYTEVVTGVPQSLFLGPQGPLLFQYISKCNLCNYTDSSTLYDFGPKPDKKPLEMDFMFLHNWFHENHITFNPQKCYYM